MVERGKHPGLQGKGIFLVDDQFLLGGYLRSCLEAGIQRVDADTTIPENLVERMRKRGIELAAVHLKHFRHEEVIVSAHNEGKIIVVIASAAPLTWQEREMINRLSKLGIPVVEKYLGCFGEVLEILAGKVSQKED